ncbi:uncharacterized protein CG3556-like [Uloborus diversus]|uniref:uncharacterized protein CG3556-like n=1 Tax=Uloborus diversus TaxID=327109 RepID=UPI002409420D|nr:uncharacterized protein CG3556-like [Uloborus diversus]
MDGAGKSSLIWIVFVFCFLPALGHTLSVPERGNNGLSTCLPDQFQCLNNKCVTKSSFCNNNDECGDWSDEKYCAFQGTCPPHWVRCWQTCIPLYFICDETRQCHNEEDENSCHDNILENQFFKHLKPSLSNWFQRRRKNGTTSNKWGHELHRTAVALYLSDPSFFAPGNTTGQEMAYELIIQLLSKFSQNKTLSSEDLALYINALLVTCIDPKDFHGHDLVSDLRKRVEEKKHANPIEIIALCNAGDTMTTKDVERISMAYNSQHRPFWIDIQALSALAMVCLSRQPTLTVDQRNLRDMVSELKKRQHLNGTVENLKTTAVVLQVLTATNSSRSDFDYEAAVKAILQQQKSDGSFPTFLESYYILPALSNNSLVGLNTSHCQNSEMTEQEALKKFRSQGGKRIQVQYSVFVGQDVDFARTWKLKVPLGSTLYNVMETIQKLDPRFRVEYNVFDGKPYPNAMFNLEDDPESGLYWFVYKRSSRSNDPQLLEASPVDIKIRENEELILWYKYEDWDDRETTQSVTPATEPPTSTATTSSPFTDATVDYITDASLIQ